MTGTGSAARSDKMSRRSLSLALFRTRLTLLWERLYAGLVPFFAALAGFAGLALFGVWDMVPAWVHVAGCGLFAGLAVWALVRAEPRLLMPSREEARQRLEQDSALPRGTLADLEDQPFQGNAQDPFWQRHKAILAQQLRRLSPGQPRALIDQTDPYALRVPALLLLMTGFVMAGPKANERLGHAFAPSFGEETPFLADLWIDPPDYTRQPATFLIRREGLPSTTPQDISVPEGSILRLRSGQLRDTPNVRLWTSTAEGRVEIDPQENSPGVYETTLTQNTVITLRAERQRANFPITVIPDTPPQIRLVEDPTIEGGLRTLLSIEIEDDYGITDGAVELRLARDLPLPPDAPTPPFPLSPETINAPALRGEPGIREVALDLTQHPWAGLPVSLRLNIADGAGHKAMSEAVSIVLPQRTFYNPLSRAVVEERRHLALAPQSWRRSLRMFTALTFAPELFAEGAQEYLLLRTAFHELEKRDGQNVEDLVDTLWPLAIALEDEGLTLARQRLVAAQAALREALANGAPQDEIDRLVEELRLAMEAYIAALAASEDTLAEEGSDNQMVEGRDLNDILDEIAELRRQGDSTAARQRLAELEQLLQNLRISEGGSGGTGAPGQSAEGNEQGDEQREGRGGPLDESGELIDQQRRLADDTYDALRGERPLREIAEAQRELAEAARQLRDQAEADTGTGSEAFEQAAEAMEAAADALSQGNMMRATRAQEDAISRLRDAASQLADEALADQKRRDGRTGDGGDGASTDQAADRDPLGRSYQTQGDTGVDIPDLSDPARIRDLTRDLRERLRNPDLPESERQYIERLLRRF